MIVEYSSNNSGGDWWLTDENWRDLEKAGWTVEWFRDHPYYRDRLGDDGRWLGGLASHATREGLSLGAAIFEWEQVTGQDSNALGCSCCGVPHTFSTDAGEYYSPAFPDYGDRYDGD